MDSWNIGGFLSIHLMQVFHMQTEEGGKATTMRGNLDDSDPLFASMRYKSM